MAKMDPLLFFFPAKIILEFSKLCMAARLGSSNSNRKVSILTIGTRGYKKRFNEAIVRCKSSLTYLFHIFFTFRIIQTWAKLQSVTACLYQSDSLSAFSGCSLDRFLQTRHFLKWNMGGLGYYLAAKKGNLEMKAPCFIPEYVFYKRMCCTVTQRPKKL